MNRQAVGLVVACALGSQVIACGGGKEDKPATAVASGDPAAAAMEAVAPETSDSEKYDKSITKKACELVTPEMVASMFDVAQDSLKQLKVVGCIYTWKSDAREVEARISLLMAHKTEARAVEWFANATRGATAEEAQQQLDEVTDRVQEKAANGELGTKVSKSVVATVMAGAMVDASRYEGLDGIGEQASINLADGSIWVRVDNLTFSVGAYSGAPQPRVNHAASIKKLDIKRITADAKAANSAWLAQTFEQRKRDGMKLAKAIVAAL